MANHQQTKPRPAKSALSAASHEQVRSAGAHPLGTSSTPPPRSLYLEALGVYEQGVAAVQEHEYARASAILRSVLVRYPDEKELHERVRLYLNVCDRHMAPGAAVPTTPEERVFAATLALNSGDYGEALGHLRKAHQESPDHDHALYMLASVLTLRDAYDEAVPLLLRAIELNPENRSMARHDPDLGPLRAYGSVRAALEASSPSKPDRRKTSRRR